VPQFVHDVSHKHHRPDAPPDPAPEYTEWIQHRLDPGYWTGARIPRFSQRGRHDPIGHRYSYALVASAIAAAVAAITYGVEVEFSYLSGALFGLAAICGTTAGWLLKCPAKRS
jgi:hypothetical protein